MSSAFEQLRDHGMVRMAVPAKTADLVTAALQITKKTFSLSEEEKRRCFLEAELSRWGWRPRSNYGKGPEIWQIDRTAPKGAWPEAMGDEYELLMALAEDCVQLLKDLFRETFAIYGSDQDASLDHEDTKVILRMLHYQPFHSELAFGPHQDFGWATAFLAESCPSLEAQVDQGNWVRGDAAANSWLIITGKLMREFTEGALQPLVHKVTMPQTDRYSLTAVLDVGERVPNNPKYQKVLEEFRKERQERTSAAVDFMRPQ